MLSLMNSSATSLRRISSPSPPLELISIKANHHQSYTSLKDIIPSSPANSPTAVSAGGSNHSIAIRNRLVKQAAWAYLQPMSASPTSVGPTLIRRLWFHFSDAVESLRRAIDRLLRAIAFRFGR